MDPEKIRAHVKFLASDCWRDAAPGNVAGTQPLNTSRPSLGCTD